MMINIKEDSKDLIMCKIIIPKVALDAAFGIFWHIFRRYYHFFVVYDKKKEEVDGRIDLR